MSKNIFSVMKAKKKREVDPDAPPRPTLLGHEKEMKGWREQFSLLNKQNNEQNQYISSLKRKINRLQAQVDALESIVRRIK
jgi:chromosome segregation ATPase